VSDLLLTAIIDPRRLALAVMMEDIRESVLEAAPVCERPRLSELVWLTGTRHFTCVFAGINPVEAGQYAPGVLPCVGYQPEDIVLARWQDRFGNALTYTRTFAGEDGTSRGLLVYMGRTNTASTAVLLTEFGALSGKKDVYDRLMRV
jgi:hypothetical protein